MKKAKRLVSLSWSNYDPDLSANGEIHPISWNWSFSEPVAWHATSEGKLSGVPSRPTPRSQGAQYKEEAICTSPLLFICISVRPPELSSTFN